MEEIACDVVPTVSGFLGFAAAWRLSTVSRHWQAIITPGLMRKVFAPPGRDLAELTRKVDPHDPCAIKGLLLAVGESLILNPSALAPNAEGQTALTWAADVGLESVLALLVGAHGLSPASLGAEANGWDPLFRAAWGGRAGCVRILLEGRANVNGCGESRYTPLMAASRWGHAECVELLLAYGAEVSRETEVGETALSLAADHRTAQLLGGSEKRPDVVWTVGRKRAEDFQRHTASILGNRKQCLHSLLVA